MFGMNTAQSLLFQNIVQNDSQERFNDIINFSDDPLNDLRCSLNNGYILYDLLTDSQKYYIDINI